MSNLNTLTSPTPTNPVRCLMSGDGAGAMGRINHNGKFPQAFFLVHGVTSRPLPVCEWCAKASSKDGLVVTPLV